jgi:hypothetical protein
MFGILQNQSFYVTYMVKNTSLSPIAGRIATTFNSQPVSTLSKLQQPPGIQPNSQGIISLNPGQTSTDILAIRATADQPSGVTVTFTEAIICNVQELKKCPPARQYATSSIFVSIAADQDKDGVPDAIEAKLLETYAPLMLFSKDNGQQEQYAPIDVIDFIHASSLISKDSSIPAIDNSILRQAPHVSTQAGATAYTGADVILNPSGGPGGQINNSQKPTTAVPTPLPRQIYLSPSSEAQHGTSWDTVLARKNVGMYGHVTMIRASQIADSALAPELVGLCGKSQPKGCTGDVFKVEYWQFFGYSHDFQVPAYVMALQFFIDPLLPIPVPPLPITELAKDIIDHGGDWCTVQLYVSVTEPDPAKAIFAIFHYAHGLQFGFDLTKPYQTTSKTVGSDDNPSQYEVNQLQGSKFGATVAFPFQGGADTPSQKNAQNNVVQLARADNNSPYVHPVVYAEWGGHEFWPSRAWSLEFVSKHGGDGYQYLATSVPNVGEIAAPMPGVVQADTVTGFSGYWGYYGWENHNKPPQGPPLHKQWQWLSNGQVSVAVRPSGPPY